MEQKEMDQKNKTNTGAHSDQKKGDRKDTNAGSHEQKKTPGKSNDTGRQGKQS